MNIVPETDPNEQRSLRAVSTGAEATLDTVYVARGRKAPPYTDNEVMVGFTLIKVIHLTEVEAAIEALTESSNGLLP